MIDLNYRPGRMIHAKIAGMIFPGLLTPPSQNLLSQDGSLVYFPNFYTVDEQAEIFESLKTEVNWRNDKITMFGKEHLQPRLTAWYGDPGKVYIYSNITMQPEPWMRSLLNIKNKIETEHRYSFNSLLLNYYRTGADHVSWHADNEKELGPSPVIASLSLGADRRFQLRHRYDKSLPIVTIEVEPGSLIIMSEEIQDFWLHRIAKTSRPVSPRINLTFRTIN